MLLTTAVFWAAAAAPLDAAIPAAGASAAVGPEIVVTAAPLSPARELILQGATVLDREEVLLELGQGLGDTLSRTPGVRSTGFGAGASRPVIRGLGEDRVRILTNGLQEIDASTVSPDHAVTVEGLEAERIEILRGPAALAYGGNSLGGLVNVIDGAIAETLPERRLSGDLYGAYTNGLRAGQGAGHVELSSGPFVLNVQGFRRVAGDYRIPDFEFSEGLRERLTAEALEAGEPAPEFREGRVTNSQSDAAQFAVGLSAVGEAFNSPAYVGLSFRRLTTEYGIPEAPGLEEEEEGGEEEPALFAGPFIDLETNRWEAKAGIRDIGPLAEARASLTVVDYGHVEVEPSGEPGTTFANNGVNARLELAHQPIGGLTGIAGFEALATDFSALGEEAFITPTDTRDFAGFLIERFEYGPFSLEGGLRGGRNTVDNVVFGQRSFTLFNYSLGAGYKPLEPLFLGLSVARTERAPTQIELYSDGPHLATASFEIGDPTLREERAVTIEGTARWTADRLTVEANGFSNFFDGFIALVANGDVEDGLPVFTYIQRDARFVGGEFSASYEWFRRGGYSLSTDASVDLVRAYFEGGGALPRIPPLTTRVGIEGASERVGLRLEWEHANAQDRTTEFEDATDGFDLFNARLTFRPVEKYPVRFLIEGRNLTDEEARNHVSFVNDLLPRPGRTIRFATLVSF